MAATMQNAQDILSTIELTLQNSGVFGDLLTDAERDYLINNSLLIPAKAGQVICKQSEVNSSLYLLMSGEVSITAKSDGEEILLGKLHHGEMFGEVAALYNIPRIATVTTSKATVFLEIPSEIFSELLSKNSILQTAVYGRFRDRTISTTLRSVPFFNLFPENAIKELCNLAKVISFKQGEILAVENEPGEGLFAITSGVARVYVNTNGKDINVAMLRQGEYFGERSLLTGEPYSASIVALTNINIVQLPSHQFREQIGRESELAYLLNVNSNERKKFLDKMRSLPSSKQDVNNFLSEIRNYLKPKNVG